LQYKANVGIVASLFKEGDAPYSLPYAAVGDHPVFMITPNGDGDHLYIDNDLLMPVEYHFDWSTGDRAPLVKVAEFEEVSGHTLPAIARGGNFFRNAKHSYWLAPVCEADGSKVGVVLFDVNDGLNKAVKVSEKYPAEGLGDTPASYMVAAGFVNGYDIELLVLAKDQGMARYKTPDIPTANIYASELSITPENAFRFTLNENAQSVVIAISKEGETITTHNAGALSKGVHTLDNPFISADFDGWSITATARPVSRPVKISNDDPVFQFYAPRGVTVDKTPESPYFGRVYITEPMGGPITEGAPADARTTQQGIYILNAAFEDVTSQGENSYTGGISWGTYVTASYQFGPMRPAVAPDGKLYISDATLNNSGVYVMDPADPSENFRPVFGGTRNTANGRVTEGGITIHSMVQNCYVMGTGANTQLFILDRTIDPSVTGKIQRFDIGESNTPWTDAPSATTFNDPGNRMQNSYGSIAYDSHGGWWLSQYRAGGGSMAVPGLIHATNNVEDYNAGGDWPSTYHGVTAINSDGSLLVLGTAPGKAQVFDVTYDADNKPTLAPKYEIAWGRSGDNLQGAAFDAAGNLYLISNGNERLMIYSLPKIENMYTTRVSQSPFVGISTIKNSEIKVYPNPVVSDLYIDGDGVQINGYTIYEMNGRMVRAATVNATKVTISISDLNTGVYIVQIRTSEGLVVKRIMKR
jgi:hypothetical protein